MIHIAEQIEDHQHVIFATEEAHECSVNKGHAHAVMILEDGSVMLGEAAGHTHPVSFDIPEEKSEIETDTERIREVVEIYNYAISCEEESRKKAKESKEFYAGKQWPDDVLSTLREQQRASLVINLTASMIDLLSGYFRRNRTDFRYKPVEEGDSKMADILFIVVKQILTKNGYHAEEVEVFEDMIKTGRGCFSVYMDFDEDISGRLKVEYFPSENVTFLPHLKKDASDCDGLVKWSWHTMKELQALFPEHKEELKMVDALFFEGEPNWEDDFVPTARVDARYMSTPEMADRTKKLTRLMVCEHREYRTVFTFIDPRGNFRIDSDNLAEWVVNSLKSMRSLEAIRRTTFRLRESIVGGGVLLSDRYITHRPYNHFSVIPVYCYKDKNDYWGKIEFGKDPQRELNKRRSQIIDIMSRMAGSGYFVDDTTFEDPLMETEFKQAAPRSGWVIKVADTQRPPLRQDPPPIPTGLVQSDQMSIAAFREVTHVSQEMLGMESKAESGVALMAKQRQGVMGNEFLFDNFSTTKRFLGKIVARYVQEFYRGRMPRILMSIEDQETIKIGGQPMGAYTPEMFDELVNTTDAMEYDVVVSESQFSATARDTNLGILMMLAQSGMPIPPEFIMMFVDVAEKEKLLQAFQAEQQRQAEREDRKYQTELQKTQIASQNRQNPGAEPPAPGQNNRGV